MVKKTEKDESGNVLEQVKENIEDGAEAAEEVVEEAITHRPRETQKEAVEEVNEAAEKESEEKSEEKKETEKAKEKEKEKSLEERKKELMEKAAKLKAKVEEAPKTEDLKEEVKGKKEGMLVPLEEYVKSGIYLGTRVVTPQMKQYVYRRRADGLAILNTDTIDEKLKEGIEYLSKFNPEDVIVVCKREAGWKPVEMFSQLTGIRAFVQKYPAGILTNTTLPDFFETEMAIITDSWLDKNAFNDVKRVGKEVLMIGDTNNFIQGADKVIIGNNKSPRSLGLIFYLLTRGYMKAKGMDTSKIPDLEYWTGEEEIGQGS